VREPAGAYRRFDREDFDEGVERERSFTIDIDDVRAFADVSGDHHPLHRETALAKERGFTGVVVHGMLVAARVSAYISADFVGTHGLLVSITCDFRRPVYCGEPLLWRARLAKPVGASGVAEIGWRVTNDSGVIVQRGNACATLPPRT
jgi:3-hydroxybutyryl-CoA dehydratase